jgi:hypothetical protein
MTLASHPYGRPYLHRPTGRVVFLSNIISDGTYQAHYQYKEPMIVQVNDLDIPLQWQIDKDYPAKVN